MRRAHQVDGSVNSGIKAAFTEDEVVNIVCDWLSENSFMIVSRCSTKEKGIDIVASDQAGVVWYIEAKGGRSGREGSRRYGLDFTAVQTIDRVMKGFFTAAAMAEAKGGSGVQIGFAIPRSPVAEAYLLKVRKALNSLGITTIWIEPSGTVTAVCPNLR
ncbi:hypothetical protein [Mesorhizobium sp.]|uniref:hypothetical protein n=1 Tax=Mesorhizobium sp. TaxID=1871066 RepID=UPI000FEA8BA3|nr:hypothetical protein [Mesorhizobium sp.]RWA97447.1 MAG: hypothetical protein EOQ33_31625 [Mesorhizobium sp.]